MTRLSSASWYSMWKRVLLTDASQYFLPGWILDWCHPSATRVSAALGLLQSASNFRPMSHTPIISRTIGRIVKDCIIDRISLGNLLGTRPYGLLGFRSCATRQYDLLNLFTSFTDCRNIFTIVFLGITSEFVRVPRPHLARCVSLDISGPHLSW